MKSVFISSTSQDLGEYRVAVDAAIRRLELRPINMTDFGAQPGGAVGVSVREVKKADIFVGILAKRYGYVPDGMTKSVTEQEYDEAVRLRMPRLMYLLDDKFPWDAARVEADPTAQTRLQAFKDRVNANEVRSLFTNPDDLAKQVTADLVKLLDKGRQQTLITRGLAALLTVIVLIALVLIADTGIRDQALHVAGIFSPTPTSTATYTPTLTPTLTPSPTSTPTATATPLEGTLFAQGQVGIVFADFHKIDANVPNIEENIERELTNAGISPIHVNHALSGRTEAQQIAQLYNATIVVWGEVALGGVSLHFEINAPSQLIDTSINSLEVNAAQLQNFDAYIFQGMDILYVVDFIQGQIAYFENDYNTALTDFNSAVDHIPAGREADAQAEALFFYRGTTFRYLNMPDKALTDYNKALQLKSDVAEVYVNRCSIYTSQKKYELALADINKALQLNPNLGVAYNNRGVIYADQGKNDLALADYNRALQLQPDNAEAHSNRAIIYTAQGKNDEALADSNRALELQPADAEMYDNRGLVYMAQGKNDEALADYNHALELNPNLADAYNNRGKFYAEQGNYVQALADFNQAIKFSPDFSVAYDNRAILYYGQGKYEEALTDLNTAIDLDPNYVLAYVNRGVIYANQNKNDKALADFNQALQIDPNNVLAHNDRGALYSDEYQFDKALADYNLALQVEPNNVQAHRNRGLAYYHLGNYAQAIAEYETFQQLTGSLEQDMRQQITEMQDALTATAVAGSATPPPLSSLMN